jgi:hypothetical protein
VCDKDTDETLPWKKIGKNSDKDTGVGLGATTAFFFRIFLYFNKQKFFPSFCDHPDILLLEQVAVEFLK